MTVEDYLGRERRMAANFNRDVAPQGIEDVEGVVVHIGHRLLGFDVMVGADVPDRRLGTAYQNQKQTLRNIGLCQVNGSPARKKDEFANADAEKWFAFRRLLEKREVILPVDGELLKQLSSRRLQYDAKVPGFN